MDNQNDLDASVILQLGNERVDILDHLAGGALWRLLDLDGRHGRRRVNAELLRVGLLHLLLLGLHNIRQSSVARLINAQVNGQNGRGGDFERLQAAVDLALNLGLVALVIKLPK